MRHVSRIYDELLSSHLLRYRQMAFLAGPRQVGKTTTARGRAAPGAYLTWDNADHRRRILEGPGSVAASVGLERLRGEAPVVVFDEIHKHGRWKGFLKGFFDTYGEDARVVVTGSSRLDVYRRGGDSLMGRYFLYRMHPLTIGEIARPHVPAELIRAPVAIADDDYRALYEHGGYPEPYVRRDRRFSTRWRTLRFQQLVREDLRDLSRVHEVAELELLATLLGERSGTQLVYSSLARDVGVAVDTIKRWIATLTSLYFGFVVRPWFANVAKSLRKEPKWYTSDWSGVDDPGARAETFVACHLLKADEGWEDLGLGRFELRYLRDKDKREVDFLVVKDRRPWFLVEVKSRDAAPSPALVHFQRQIRAPHAFQAAMDMDYVDADCFARSEPTVVPARTLLAQLL